MCLAAVIHLQVLLWLEGSVAEPLGPGADGNKHQPEEDGRPKPAVGLGDRRGQLLQLLQLLLTGLRREGD